MPANPALTIIIPMYNAATVIRQCLDAIFSSEEKDFEVIVIDDHSTDQSTKLIEDYPITIKSTEKQSGPARARNIGAQAARGEILYFVDSDVLIKPDTLTKILTILKKHTEIAALIGSYDTKPAGKGFFARYKNLMHHYVHQQSNTEAYTFWGACGAIRREVFLAMNGFDESYRKASIEDIELGFRLSSAGHQIRLEKSIQVTHLKKWTFKQMVLTDIFLRGIPWTKLMLGHKEMKTDLNLKISHRISAVLVYSLVFLLAAGFVSPWMLNLAAINAVVLVLLNLDVYRYFRKVRGNWFMIRAIPTHWLYYAYSLLAFVLGVIAYQREKIAN